MLEQAGGGAVFLLVAVGLVVLAGFALVEAWMLFYRRRPITQYVRQGIDEHARVAAAIAFLIGLFAGHFWR